MPAIARHRFVLAEAAGRVRLGTARACEAPDSAALGDKSVALAQPVLHACASVAAPANARNTVEHS